MFCGNCGKQLADGSASCDGCGTALMPQAMPIPKKPFSIPGKKATIWIVTGIICLALVIAGVIVGVIVGIRAAGNKPEKVAAKVIEATMLGDPASLVECFPDFMIRKYCSDFGLPVKDEKALVNALKQRITLEDLETVKVLGAARDDLEDCEEYIENLEDYGATSLERLQVQECCMVRISALVSGEMEEFEVICIKIKNHWYALDMD